MARTLSELFVVGISMLAAADPATRFLPLSLEYLQAVAEDVMASVTPESTNGLFINVTLGLISVQTE